MNLTKQKTETIEIIFEQDIVKVRQVIKNWTTECRFKVIDQTKLITAASELARNTFLHGGGGEVVIELVTDGFKTGIRAYFIDKGRGIPDIGLALKDHYTTGTGLGLGLGGAKRLVDEFSIDSKPNEGTKVTIIKWK